MAINQSKLKSSAQLLRAIEELDEKKQEVMKYSDKSILHYVMDLDEHVSVEIMEEMLDVTEAYRITVAQLIDKEIERKAGLLDKIKLRNDEEGK